MHYRLSIPGHARRTGELPEALTSLIREHLDEHGFVVLDRLFDADLLGGLHGAYVAEYGAMGSAEMATAAGAGGPSRFLEVGPHRYEIVVPMVGEFRDPRVYAGGLMLSLMSQLLGGEFHLSSFSIVVSFPGSTRQHIHRDYGSLFGLDQAGTNLPTYALNLGVPLIDVDRRTGPTGVWPGSHRWDPARKPADSDEVTMPETRLGDGLIIDYRTFHAGMPNEGPLVRPNLYLVYSRPWFFDEINHRRRAPIDMPLDADEPMPEAVRRVLTRAFTEENRRILARKMGSP